MFAGPVDELAARLSILQSIADYSYTFDGRDAEGWSQVFTEDAVWEFRPSDPASALAGFRAVGREAIRAWAEQRYRELGPGARFLHHQSTTSFDALDPAGGATRTLVTVSRCDAGDPPRLSVAGVYHDLWRPTPAGWRLAQRILVT